MNPANIAIYLITNEPNLLFNDVCPFRTLEIMDLHNVLSVVPLNYSFYDFSLSSAIYLVK